MVVRTKSGDSVKKNSLGIIYMYRKMVSIYTCGMKSRVAFFSENERHCRKAEV